MNYKPYDLGQGTQLCPLMPLWLVLTGFFCKKFADSDEHLEFAGSSSHQNSGAG